MSEVLQDRTIGLGAPSGEEELRFIRNFHDVFLSIGLGMFIVGLGIVSSLIVSDMVEGMFDGDFAAAAQRSALTVAGVSFVNAAIVWGLAEVFARSRRLFLPAIVILLGFVAFFSGAVGWLYVGLVDISDAIEAEALTFKARFLIFLVAAAGTFAAFAYYMRMKLPFAMGLGGAALAGTGVTALALYIPELLTGRFLLVQFLSGVFLFLLGVYFDARDPERRTRLSDNGFWLHFFAAPLIFFSVLQTVAGDGPAGDTGGAAATLIVVVIFALISILINRRALLVAGLISAIIATAFLIREAGVSGAWTAATTLLILGGAMVLLGGGWHTVRRALVAPFPKEGGLARIIPPETGPNPRDQVVG
ncbi:MAG: hypothetical protein AAGJ87_08990 [Pseudomonadota bacterium]